MFFIIRFHVGNASSTPAIVLLVVKISLLSNLTAKFSGDEIPSFENSPTLKDVSPLEAPTTVYSKETAKTSPSFNLLFNEINPNLEFNVYSLGCNFLAFCNKL